MIPDIENMINLRKKLVEEVTSEILVWSNKETFSFSINKLACFDWGWVSALMKEKHFLQILRLKNLSLRFSKEKGS